MKNTSKSLGIMLSTGPDHPNLDTVCAISREALAAQYRVYLYLIDEGTKSLGDQRLEPLRGLGLKLFVCAYGAERQGIYPSDQATFSGLVVLSDLIKGCERFLSFN